MAWGLNSPSPLAPLPVIRISPITPVLHICPSLPPACVLASWKTLPFTVIAHPPPYTLRPCRLLQVEGIIWVVRKLAVEKLPHSLFQLYSIAGHSLPFAVVMGPWLWYCLQQESLHNK